MHRLVRAGFVLLPSLLCAGDTLGQVINIDTFNDGDQSDPLPWVPGQGYPATTQYAYGSSMVGGERGLNWAETYDSYGDVSVHDGILDKSSSGALLYIYWGFNLGTFHLDLSRNNGVLLTATTTAGFPNVDVYLFSENGDGSYSASKARFARLSSFVGTDTFRAGIPAGADLSNISRIMLVTDPLGTLYSPSRPITIDNLAVDITVPELSYLTPLTAVGLCAFACCRMSLPRR